MSAKTAAELGLSADDARFLVRFDISKSNYGAPQAPAWLRRLSGGVMTKTALPNERSPKRRTAAREVSYD
jgi:hypothetical protein